MVRAKFVVTKKEQMQGGVAVTDADGYPVLDDNGAVKWEQGIVETITMNPVYHGGNYQDENARFWASSPSGQLVLTCVNPKATAQLQIGKVYYNDLTPAE